MTRLHSTSRVRTRFLKSDGSIGANHESSGTRRRAREEVLGHKEEELRKLASEGNRDESFREIIPLLKPLRSYIKRRLRGAGLTRRANIPVLSSVDMLDDVVRGLREVQSQAETFDTRTVALPAGKRRTRPLCFEGKAD